MPWVLLENVEALLDRHGGEPPVMQVGGRVWTGGMGPCGEWVRGCIVPWPGLGSNGWAAILSPTPPTTETPQCTPLWC